MSDLPQRVAPVTRILAASALAVVLALAGIVARAEASAPRVHGSRVPVTAQIRIMDGDTMEIRWSGADVETVRVLGIDTAELFGRGVSAGRAASSRGFEARGFARGAFTVARRHELLRAAERDRHGRTLGYFFLDGRNYSVLVIEARLARETLSRYGDQGLPREAAEVRAAARRARAGTADRP